MRALTGTRRRTRLLAYLAVVPLGLLGVAATAGPAAALTPTTITVSAPATATPGHSVRVGFTFSAARPGADGGSLTLTVFGPQPSPPADCTSGGTTVLGAGIGKGGGGGLSESRFFGPLSLGIYWWYASYTGTSQTAPSNSGCGPGMPHTTVGEADLAIGTHSPVTTDATGPSGATVTYGAPAVTDGDDASPPAAVCTPPSGSVFAIGTTTVTCTATDPDDADSPVSTTFKVTVEGAAAQLADLAQAVQSLPVRTGLDSTVALAQRQVAAGHPRLACLTLYVFIFQVHIETPWLIPPGTAAQLIAAAGQIRTVLGCGTGLF